MKNNLTISLILTGLVCFFTLILAPSTNAQKSDPLRGIHKKIIKKKIYPMQQVKGEISLTPPNSMKPKPKSDISPVSKASVTKKSSPSSARNGKYMPVNTMGFPENDIPPYTSIGKIDPFVPLIKATVIKKPNLPKPPDDTFKTLLEKIDLSQLKLTAIVIRDRGGNRGLVQESSGKGHIIVLNTKIGTRGGKVVEIKKDRLIIEERGQDDFGKIIAKKRELTFPVN